MIKPLGSAYRKASMDKCFEALAGSPANILELGMTRGLDNYDGDGHATLHWAWYVAQFGGSLVSIDINPHPILITSELLKRYEIPTKNIFLICADAINFLEFFGGYVDLLYLDAWDYLGSAEDLENSSQKHLEAFLKAEARLKEGSLVMIDDIHDVQTFVGKGRYLIPHLIKLGYENLHLGWQTIFRKPPIKRLDVTFGSSGEVGKENG